jgi:LuxR family transcriptional regulator, quorum-sensing system regulator BjaR1
MRMLDRVMALAEPILTAADGAAASAALLEALEPEGATYLQTRLYCRPPGPLTNESHFAAGGVVSRIAPSTWPDSAAFRFVCFDCNPLLEPIRRGMTRYRFSEFAPRQDRAFGRYWEALSEAKIGEAVCATAYGRGRRIGSLHLGFEREDLTESDAMAIHIAGAMLVERLMALAPESSNGEEQALVQLTPRERDSLAFVAEGKTDWEIGVLLGVSQTTARFHIDNARRKFDAVNRTHAVARFLASHSL